MSNEDQNKIQEFESNVDFKVSDGKVYRSMKKAIIPASIGNLDVKIETNVTACDILLLLSRESMKATHTQINFAEDEVTILGKTLNLLFTSSGCYSVPVCKPKQVILQNKDQPEVSVMLTMV